MDGSQGRDRDRDPDGSKRSSYYRQAARRSSTVGESTATDRPWGGVRSSSTASSGSNASGSAAAGSAAISRTHVRQPRRASVGGALALGTSSEDRTSSSRRPHTEASMNDEAAAATSSYQRYLARQSQQTANNASGSTTARSLLSGGGGGLAAVDSSPRQPRRASRYAANRSSSDLSKSEHVGSRRSLLGAGNGAGIGVAADAGGAASALDRVTEDYQKILRDRRTAETLPPRRTAATATSATSEFTSARSDRASLSRSMHSGGSGSSRVSSRLRYQPGMESTSESAKTHLAATTTPAAPSARKRLDRSTVSGGGGGGKGGTTGREAPFAAPPLRKSGSMRDLSGSGDESDDRMSVRSGDNLTERRRQRRASMSAGLTLDRASSNVSNDSSLSDGIPPGAAPTMGNSNARRPTRDYNLSSGASSRLEETTSRLEQSRLDRARRHRDDLKSTSEGNTTTTAGSSTFSSTGTSTSTPSVIDVSLVREPRDHYQAHSPQVEKYLSRTKLIDGVRARSTDHAEVGGHPPALSTRASSDPMGGAGGAAGGAAVGTRSSTDTLLRSRDARLELPTGRVSVRERVKRTESQEQLLPATTSASAGGAATTTTATATTRPDPVRQRASTGDSLYPSTTTTRTRSRPRVTGYGERLGDRTGMSLSDRSSGTTRTAAAAATTAATSSSDRKPSIVSRYRTTSSLPPTSGSSMLDPSAPTAAADAAGGEPADETARTHSSAVRGWSTHSSRRRSSPTKARQGSSDGVGGGMNVQEYLKERNARKGGTVDTATAALPPTRKDAQSSAVRERPSSSLNSKVVVLSDKDVFSSEEEETDTDTDADSDDSSLDEPTTVEWSVRLCVVSAVDLPPSVVPNLPFSPILKVGLVKLPAAAAGVNSPSSLSRPGKDRLLQLSTTIERSGLTAVPKARVRCTTTKILSKRDNGAVEFHEELRWDRVKDPHHMALVLELSSRAVMTPANFRESPPAQPAAAIAAISGTANDANGRGGIFRRSGSRTNTEMETANAAAAVANLLVNGEEAKDDGGITGPLFDSKVTNTKNLVGSPSEIDVKLRKRKQRRKPRMSEDLHLGSRIIPLDHLPLEKALNESKSAHIEQWFELENLHEMVVPPEGGRNVPSSNTFKRKPRILLDISFSSPEIRDDSENEMEEDNPEKGLKASFSKRASLKIKNQLKDETVAETEDIQEPALMPGVIDYICIVGARDIGDQKADDGSRGWVNSSPECAILEQFPPNDDLHNNAGRAVTLPTKVEWFCFPEGCRLWRGTTPPNHEELNLKRLSSSAPGNLSPSIAQFDAYLGCTTSLGWFVFASNSDEYGSENAKTYGAVIRFYVPAPTGIDPTQDDFAQAIIGAQETDVVNVPDSKRLWVPIGICITSSLPIVGAMEAILLRLCDNLSSRGMDSVGSGAPGKNLASELKNLILKFQKPIAGVVGCTIPFLTGERLHLSLPSRSALPPLPHGNAVSTVCRLLGAEGINYLLAAVLTENKILIHSDDITNLGLVGEVMTALIYPFQWTCPYVPVVPLGMMEILEAPCPFFLGIPTANMKYIEPYILEDLVVVDIDSDFGNAGVYEEKRNGPKTFQPSPLPLNVARNIATAVHRLARNEADAVENLGVDNMAMHLLPRLEAESLAEREFRLFVALEVCSLIQGFSACTEYASSQPVFDIDKFLQTAPALFEEHRGKGGSNPQGGPAQFLNRQVVSPRSRKFLSELVNCQQFHQFLEILEHESVSFFLRVMNAFEAHSKTANQLTAKRTLSLEKDKAVAELSEVLRKQDERIATYSVKIPTETENAAKGSEVKFSSHFPRDMLQPISIAKDSKDEADDDATGDSDGIRHVSIEYLVELEKNPWRFETVLGIDVDESDTSPGETVKLSDALGERRYRAWKATVDNEKYGGDDASEFSDTTSRVEAVSLDISTLLISSDERPAPPIDPNDPSSNISSAQRRIADAKDRDVLRRCLEKADVAGDNNKNDAKSDKSRDLINQAEIALRNPSAREFLLSVLNRKSLEHKEVEGPASKKRSALKMELHPFEVLVKLGFAMLDACLEDQDFRVSYALLKSTAGLYCSEGPTERDSVYMTGRIAMHPIFANLELWVYVRNTHVSMRQSSASSSSSQQQQQDTTKESATASEGETDQDTMEYETTVATMYEMIGYGIPAEELARFASRVSEDKGWFQNERGQKLIMLARRLTLRREQSRSVQRSASGKSDIEMMSAVKRSPSSAAAAAFGRTNPRSRSKWVETSWCHPAAQISNKSGAADKGRRGGSIHGTTTTAGASGDSTAAQNPGSSYMKRSAVTALAHLGKSVVATGGLDGGVFIARTIRGKTDDDHGIRGAHLDWGSSGSRYTVGSTSAVVDGEYGVGAVSCLAATRGPQFNYQGAAGESSSPTKGTQDTSDPPSDEDVLAAMEGCRIVAGTTCGDLRVWSVKDVFSAIFFSNGGGAVSPSSAGEGRRSRGGDSHSSSYASRRKTGTDYAAGSSLTRLKFSLRGRALSGHRGGVSCVDVPNNVYRPDSIVSGGADGLIKLWSLRSPGAAIGARKGDSDGISTSQFLKKASVESMSPRTKAARGGDALSILSGHGGRVLCVKTAWHGDRLLSGGADRTVRVWDLAGSGGRCVHSLTGHFGWVTQVRYWGANTIISASTDRSICLWDARVRNSPLFALRHHYAPITDVLVGSRTDPIMVSAASDGTIAAWDFRHLSGSMQQREVDAQRCCVVRDPAAKLYMHDYSSRKHVFGPVLLGRGSKQEGKTVASVGGDSVVREWDVQTGEVLSEHVTGHADTVTHFMSLADSPVESQLDSAAPQATTATITASWDGTVRMRKLVKVS